MSNKFFRDRYSILSFLIIVMIVIVAYKLFSLQIVKGQYYVQESEKRMLRVNTVKAPRGEIVDRFGMVLANNRAGFTVEITKTKTDDAALNKALLEIAGILEKNNESYKDNLPIIFPFQFVFNSDKEKEAWKKKYNVPIDANAQQAFGELRKKYKVDPKYNDNDARKIITLRYEMSEQGYNSFKSVVLAFDISKESVSVIEERHQEFPGVNIVVNPIRNYPYGLMASHILGYIGKINQTELQKFQSKGYSYSQSEMIGKAGIESYSEIYLRGDDGKKFVEADVTGRLSKTLAGQKLLDNESPVPGAKVTLTIDQKVQKAAETALEATITDIKSGKMKDGRDVKGGTAIAVDVTNGEILALASYPNYDPSVFSKGITIQEWNKVNNNPLKPLLNRSINGRYPPGSTFKMITAIAAIQEGKTTPEETVQDTGTYDYYQKNGPACWLWRQRHETHGWVNTSEALKVSCNIYFYEMGRRLGIEKLAEYASKFGLTQKTGIELYGEETNIIASAETRKKLHQQNKYAYPNKDWYPGDTLAAAIGQSDTIVTPISMASYISTLANGGKQYNLHLLKTITSYDGKRAILANSETPAPISQMNIKPEALKAVFKGMKGVTSEEHGTAYNTFKGFPIEIAGKTGSAQTGIVGQSAHAWFTGFAPFDNPKIAVVVMLENGGSGGYTAPVAKAIFAEYFQLNNLLPEEKKKEESTTQVPNQAPADAKPEEQIPEVITGQVE